MTGRFQPGQRVRVEYEGTVVSTYEDGTFVFARPDGAPEGYRYGSVAASHVKRVYLAQRDPIGTVRQSDEYVSPDALHPFRGLYLKVMSDRWRCLWTGKFKVNHEVEDWPVTGFVEPTGVWPEDLS